MPRPRPLSLLTVPFLLLGCGGSGPAASGTREPVALAIVDSLVIPADAADLADAGYMTISPDGDIVVSQSQDGNLKVFGDTGLVRTVGRSGEGPGEFTTLTRIGWIGDTLWTLDPSLKRTSWFDRSYTFLGSTPDPIEVRMEGATSDTSANGYQAYVQAALPGGALRVLAPFSAGHPPAWAAGLDSGAAPFLSVDARGVVRHRLAVQPPDPCQVNYAVGDRGRGTTMIPFCKRWLDTGWDGGERLGIVEITAPENGAPSYRVAVIDASGDTVFSRSFPYRPIAVTQHAVDSLRERLDRAYANVPAVYRQAMPHPEPASTFPPVRRIVLGRDGTVWIEEFRSEPGHYWLMLSSTGEPMAHLALPASVELKVAEDGTVWGTEENADGLLGIVRYHLSGWGGAALRPGSRNGTAMPLSIPGPLVRHQGRAYLGSVIRAGRDPQPCSHGVG